MNAEKRSIPPKVLLQLLAAVTCSVAVVLLPLNVKAAENNVLPAISSTEQQSDVIANGKENGISWSVTSDGLLTLTTESGVSTIKNYDYNETYAPWEPYAVQVKKIVIEKNITYIGKYAFYGCKNATEIEIGSSVKEIASHAFGSYFTSVTIPASVTSIDKYAFHSAGALNGYHVDSQNKNYCNDEMGVLFDKDKTQLLHAPINLEGKYVVPDTVQTLVDSCFNGCEKLTELEIGDSVTSIDSSAFGTCAHLKKLSIGDSVKNVSDLFSRCKLPELETLNLGSGFTEIKNLYGLPSLLDINVSENNETYSSVDGILYSKDKTILQKYPCGRTGTFQVPDGVKDARGFENCKIEAVILPEGVTKVGYFRGCKNLVKVQLPDTVTEIGGFSDCTSLEEIVLPDGIETLNQYAFSECSKLTNITLPEKLTLIEQYAFQNCTSLKEITLPKQLSKLDWSVFTGCTALSTVTFKGAAPYIVDSAFKNVTATCYYPKNNLSWTDEKKADYGGTLSWVPYEVNEFDGEEHTYAVLNTNATLAYQINESALTAVITHCNTDATGALTIPDTIDEYKVIKIGAEAFKDCLGLESVVIPQTVSDIEESAFQGCKKLANVTLPEGITEIKPYTFSGCGLTSLEFPDSLVKIGDYAFQNLKVHDLTIPDHIEICGTGAFANSSLNSVVLPDGLTEISDSMFDGSHELRQVKLPQNLKRIGNKAFSTCYELRDMVLPEGVTFIGDEAFQVCGAYVTYGAYYSASGFTSITLPSTLQHIGKKAFYMCQSLRSIVIPDQVTEIDTYTFAYCYKMATIVFPANITRIAGDAFIQCADRISGTTMTFRWNAPVIESGAFSSVTGTAYYPSNNPDWTNSMLQQYGAKKLTWVAQEMEKPDGAGGGSGGNPGGEDGDNSGETGGDSKPINVNVSNSTSQAGENGASLTPPENGWTTGSNTFSVSAGAPCMVAISQDDGKTYERLPATKNSDGSYSYTAEDMTEDSTLAVMLLGDINGDGQISTADEIKGKAAVLNKVELEPLQKLAADVNHDGNLTTADITRLKSTILGKASLEWE